MQAGWLEDQGEDQRTEDRNRLWEKQELEEGILAEGTEHRCQGHQLTLGGAGDN